MRIVFMGTPEFAVPSLKAVAAAYDVALVVTRPDAVRSRGKKLEPSPVKACALDLGLPVLEAKRMDAEAIDAVRAAAPDLICVVAFGCILPDELLAVAPLGAINVHGSLLPRWRGAAPIQRAILAGDKKTGVSIMRVAHDLDAGAWCRQVSTPIGTKTASQLFDELAQAGAPELVAAAAQIADGTVTWHEQDPAQVTIAEKVKKDKPKRPGGTKQLKKDLAAAEKRMEKLDQLLEELNQQKEAAASDYQKLQELLEQEGAYTAEYDQLMETWEELSETIAAEEG